MSTTSLTAPRPVDRRAAHTRPGLGRLVLVELRKSADTRAGSALLVAVAVLTVAVVLVRLATGTTADHTFAAVLDLAILPAGILLPVAGVLLVTTEWSQRTGLITFALVPDRARVIAAKVLTAVVLAAGALLVVVVAVTAGVLVAGPGDDAFAGAGALVGQTTVYLVAGMLTPVAFGMLLRASAPALVVLYALPTAWAILLSLEPFSDAAPWLDTGRAYAPMHQEAMTSTQWAQAATAMLLWTALPLAAGVWRTLLDEPVA